MMMSKKYGEVDRKRNTIDQVRQYKGRTA